MKEQVLSHLRRTPQRKITLRTLAKQLKADRGARFKALKTALFDLEEAAYIASDKKKRYGLIEAFGYARGTLQMKRKGFAFLLPEDGDGKDLFIPRGRTKDAMHKDLVLARITRRRGYMLDEASVVKVLSRHRKTMVGTIEQKGNRWLLVPDESVLQDEFIVSEKHRANAQAGDKVLGRIIRYDAYKQHAVDIVRVIGKAGEKGVDIESKILEHGIEAVFPQPVLSAAAAFSAPNDADAKGRRDLRKSLTVTIDGEDAKDFDDALSAEKAADGALNVGVHIADVAHYVKKGSALDKEAARRSTSIYLPDRVIPMLPASLSEGVCSLNEGQDRLTMSCVMTIDESGKIVAYDIVQSVIRSHYRLSYEGLAAANALDSLDDPALKSMLSLLKEAADRLKRARFKAGSLDLETPETKVVLDEKGRAAHVKQTPSTAYSSVIEELMLAANKTVAKHIKQKQLPFIYRVHDVPEPERIEAFFGVLDALGMTHPERRYTRDDLQIVSAKLKEKDSSGALAILMVRALPRAVYAPEAKGHFGLGFKHYSHFTSPIRRYPDLMVHRLLKHYLFSETSGKKSLVYTTEKLSVIAAEASRKERLAADLEHDVSDMKKAEYMASHIGESFSGTITSVTPFGFYVTLSNGIEGLVHMSALEDDYYDYDEHTLRLVGRDHGRIYKLTDAVEVLLADVDIPEGTIDFVPSRS